MRPAATPESVTAAAAAAERQPATVAHTPPINARKPSFATSRTSCMVASSRTAPKAQFDNSTIARENLGAKTEPGERRFPEMEL
ncbi:hypothetical protein CTI14_00815 [Methylobacterium radiotolerans]|nr:hypothetical protein CTI14_00815 [Methylobacterium radiotolerans]